MNRDALNREELIRRIDRIRDELSHPRRLAIARPIEKAFPGSDVLNLCGGDLSTETIAEMCLRVREVRVISDRQELLSLVKKLMAGDVTSEAEENILVSTFAASCRHPAKTDLIYYSEEVFGKEVEVTAEMVVDKALSGN